MRIEVPDLTCPDRIEELIKYLDNNFVSHKVHKRPGRANIVIETAKGLVSEMVEDYLDENEYNYEAFGPGRKHGHRRPIPEQVAKFMDEEGLQCLLEEMSAVGDPFTFDDFSLTADGYGMEIDEQDFLRLLRDNENYLFVTENIDGKRAYLPTTLESLQEGYGDLGYEPEKETENDEMEKGKAEEEEEEEGEEEAELSEIEGDKDLVSKKARKFGGY